MAAAGDSRLAAIIFGATGFTGKHAVLEILKLSKEKGNVSWGIAGRNKAKLEGVLKEVGKKAGEDLIKIPIFVADVNDHDSLCQMARQARIVINCAGPYRFFGEAVVKACVESGTHHVDVSGEPQYMETMQLKYHKAAEEKGVYIISACGFDSIPSDLGTVYFVNKFRETFGGDVNSVETYVSSEIDEGVSVNGALVHYGTWESAIYGLAYAKELKSIRSKLFPNRLPVMKPTLKARSVVHKNEFVKGWNLPFLGSDRSVIRRSQRHFFENDKQRPVQARTYFSIQSLFSIPILLFYGLIFAILAKFSLGRKLLLQYPRFFSYGMFSHEGPTEEVMKALTFAVTICCEGWTEKLSEPIDQHSTPPNKMLIGKVSGRDPGYGATCTALVLAGLTVLEENNRMPGRGGVLPPGAAFAKTSLVEKLQANGYTFEVIKTGNIK